MLRSKISNIVKLAQKSNPLIGDNVVGCRHFTSPAVKRFREMQRALPKAKAKLATTAALPHSLEDMENNTLLTLAALENHDARIEVLKRHIMSVDHCSHAEATKTFQKIAKKNREGMALAALPYQLGIAAGVMAAIGSIPLVFNLHTTLWFNEYFVTTEVPGSEDLETALEVGSWAWNWMEPPLGTLSFALLCLQFSRYVGILSTKKKHQ